MQSSSKFQQSFLTDFESIVLIFIWKHENPRRVKTIQNYKVTARGITTLDFMLSDKATIITEV